MDNKFKKIKLIAFDIDGTLIEYGQHSVKENVLQMLDTLKKKEYKVALVTGRNYITIGDKLDLFEEVDYFIGANGIFVYDVKQKKEIYNDYINLEHVKIIMPKLLDVVDSGYLCDDKHLYISKTLDTTNWFMKQWVDFLKPLDYNIINPDTISIIALTHSDPLQYNKVEQVIKETHLPLSITSTWTRGTFISNKNVDKWTGLDWLAKHLGLTLENVMAFGDGSNDIKMIQHSGIGIAVQGKDYAIDTINKVADYICDSPKEDGPYRFLKENKFI
ncbi:YcsE-related riboflavin metabolism phosphatase [Mycoplasma phocimorsus]|uniref:YcsE-related riboflavin metabolism phosphatase n=1 Tax=Mycoplasma phocimorsus TaxID=3045839 RepID=UPI0024BFA54E|nr:HAD family hydrolase [Mycoplasma phocimorsus]MDJ1648843.1 HAD family hydrolase [Mycoplasma phocimorsus]